MRVRYIDSGGLRYCLRVELVDLIWVVEEGGT